MATRFRFVLHPLALAAATGGLAVAAAFAVASCAGAPQPALTSPIVEQAAQTTRPDLVILVSIDGFSPDYLGKGQTPVLDGLVAGGAFGSMRPSFNFRWSEVR